MKKNIQEADKVIELITKLNSSILKDESLTCISDEQYDKILEGVKDLSISIYNHKLFSPSSHDRLDELTNVMTSLAELDFTQKATVDGSENHLDYIAIGLNLLSYQLAKQVEPMKVLKLFFETLKEPVVVTSAEGKITLMNNSALLLSGFEMSDIYLKSINEFIVSEKADIAEGSYYNTKIKNKEGKLIPLPISVYNFKSDSNKLIGSVYYSNTIDKQAIRAGINSIEEKNPLDFNRIHHDISGPIKSMKGAISLGKIQAESNDALKIYDVIEKCRIMIEGYFVDLFDMIFLKSNKLVYEKISLPDEVKTITSTFRLNEEYKNIEINVSIDPEVQIRSNKKLVISIINNLISNALKYSAKRKDKSFVGVRIIKTNTGCQIQVSDNGIGIKQENLSLIFNPHFRASYEEEGKGLGLYIVAQAVQKLGGTIEVSSEMGLGSTFTVSLPDIK